MRNALVVVLVIVGVGAVLWVRSCVSTEEPPDLPPPAKPEVAKRPSENRPRPVGAPETGGPKTAVRKTQSTQTEPAGWKRESDLRAKGFATPRDAYESLLYASTGGDVAGTAAAIFLTGETRERAEKMLARLPPEKRAEYGTPERLIASLQIGASALIGAARAGESAYQIINDEPGIGITPRALGLAEHLAADPNYRTLRSKARTPDGQEAEPIMVFMQTGEGWKWVVPPSMVDALGRLLKGEMPPPAPRR